MINDNRDDEFSLMNCNLYSQIGIVLCWYLSEENMPYEVSNEESPEETPLTAKEIAKRQREVNKDAKRYQKYVGKMIGLIPEIVAGDFKKISGKMLYDVWDALGSYPDGNDSLEEIYKLVGEEYNRRCKENF